VAAALAFAESQVQGGEYLMGSQLTLADIAMGVALAYMDLRYDHAWQPSHPGLAAWFVIFARRSAFVETMPS